MGPFKCPDCGIWWAGLEHRCKWYDLHPPATTDTKPWSGDFTVRCTCPPDRGDNYLGTCPIHDVTVTYTVSLPPMPESITWPVSVVWHDPEALA